MIGSRQGQNAEGRRSWRILFSFVAAAVPLLGLTIVALNLWDEDLKEEKLAEILNYKADPKFWSPEADQNLVLVLDPDSRQKMKRAEQLIGEGTSSVSKPEVRLVEMRTLTQVHNQRLKELRSELESQHKSGLTENEYLRMSQVFSKPAFHALPIGDLSWINWEINGFMPMTKIYFQHLKDKLEPRDRLAQLEKVSCYYRASLESESSMISKLVDLGVLKSALTEMTQTLVDSGWPKGFRFHNLADCTDLKDRGIHLYRLMLVRETRLFSQLRSLTDFELQSSIGDPGDPGDSGDLSYSRLWERLQKILYRPNQTANQYLASLHVDAFQRCPGDPICSDPEALVMGSPMSLFLNPINPTGKLLLRAATLRQFGGLLKMQSRLAEIKALRDWLPRVEKLSREELEQSHRQLLAQITTEGIELMSRWKPHRN